MARKPETAGLARIISNQAPPASQSYSRAPAIDPSHARRCSSRRIVANSVETIDGAKHAVAHSIAEEIAAKLIEHDYFVSEKWGDGMTVVKCDLDVIVPPRASSRNPTSRHARPTAYLIAATFRDAQTTAEIDWGWTRTGASALETPSGERVHIITDVDQLRGLRRGTKLYRGHRWFDRGERERATLEMLIANGQIIIGEPEVRGDGTR